LTGEAYKTRSLPAVQSCAVADEGESASRQWIDGEGEFVYVEAEDAGRLALEVDGGEKERAADAEDGFDIAAVGEIFLGSHGDGAFVARYQRERVLTP
jgi:hypothetical protein